MFFEPVPAGEEAMVRRSPESPPWSSPPGGEAGVTLAVNRTVARSANVAVCWPAIRYFSSGGMLEMEIGFPGPQLPDRLLRLGVRYPDGSKATTLERHRRHRDDGPPDGPVLSWWAGGSGTRGGGTSA